MGEGATVAAARALAEVIPRLARLIAGALETDAEVALSLRQYRILERLAERPQRTTELASTSGVSQPTASAAVASLEARGLVTREPDPDDRRATRILLTPTGEATFTTAKRRVLERLTLVTSHISSADAEALQRLQPVLLEGMDRARDALLAARSAGPRPRGP